MSLLKKVKTLLEDNLSKDGLFEEFVSIIEVLVTYEEELVDYQYLLKEIAIRKNMANARAFAAFAVGIGVGFMALGYFPIGAMLNSASDYFLEGLILVIAGCVSYFGFDRLEKRRIKRLWGLRKHP